MSTPVDQSIQCVAADLLFFRRRPNRRYRLRLAGRVEIAMARQYRGLAPAPQGTRVFVAVRRTSPTGMQGAMGFALDAGETDFDEVAARESYRRLAAQNPSRPPSGVELWWASPVTLAGSLGG